MSLKMKNLLFGLQYGCGCRMIYGVSIADYLYSLFQVCHIKNPANYKIILMDHGYKTHVAVEDCNI